jgi:hypothetical protein
MRLNDNKFNALFVPRFSGASSFKLIRKLWYISSVCQWQSLRYTSTDNLSAMPGYALFSLQTGKEIRMKQHAFTITAGADNVLNHSYEIMPGRPMPMRSFWLKANLKLSNK